MKAIRSTADFVSISVSEEYVSIFGNPASPPRGALDRSRPQPSASCRFLHFRRWSCHVKRAAVTDDSHLMSLARSYLFIKSPSVSFVRVFSFPHRNLKSHPVSMRDCNRPPICQSGHHCSVFGSFSSCSATPSRRRMVVSTFGTYVCVSAEDPSQSRHNCAPLVSQGGGTPILPTVVCRDGQPPVSEYFVRYFKYSAARGHSFRLKPLVPGRQCQPQ